MWKILSIFAVVAFGFIEANTWENGLEEYYKKFCLKNANMEAFEKLKVGLQDLEKCTGKKEMLDNMMSFESKDQWEQFYTKLCGELDTKKICYKDFNTLVLPCLGETEFKPQAISTNTTIDVWQHICVKERPSVIDFALDNGAKCFLNGNTLAEMCIFVLRSAKNNIVTSKEAASFAEQCYFKVPCGPQR